MADSTWDRIFRTVSLSSVHAIFTAPPKRSQAVDVDQKNRFNRRAQVMAIMARGCRLHALPPSCERPAPEDNALRAREMVGGRKFHGSESG